MATMTTVDGQFLLTHTISGSGNVGVLLSTENKFVDKNIGMNIYTPDAGNLSFEATNNTAIDVTVNTTVTDGKYQLTASIGGTVTPASAGWINSSAQNIQDNSVIVGRIAQSSFTGTTVTPAGNQQTVTITPGYYHEDRKVIIKSADTGTQADVTSGAATLGSLSFNYNSISGKFDMSSTATMEAPTVSTAGYISSGSNTLHTSSNAVSSTVNKIGVGVTVIGGAAKTPSISKQDFTISGVTNAAGGTATTTAPTSGVYVKVKSGATNSTVSSQATVTTAGYGTTAQFNADSASITTVTINASPDTYIPITTTGSTVNGKTVSYGSGWISEGSVTVATTSVTPHTNATAANNNITWGDGWITQNTIGNASASVTGTTTAAEPTIAKSSAAGTGGTNVGTSVSTSKPSSGYFISVKATAPQTNISTISATVQTGYLGHSSQISGSATINSAVSADYFMQLPTAGFSVSENNVTVNSAGYIGTNTTVGTISSASFNNSATANVTYTTVQGPALVSGDYLYVNAGYTPAIKMSLADLVPDTANVGAATSHTGILTGINAYNIDGQIIAGSMATYNGSYTLTNS